ncbi:hypothetical protein [Sphingomonas ginkgonis]|uniref:hypothetical protein n=1 Tax=Sphingomonas ginkgonis TaxID=2315330 RepID=UPI00163967A0|nr:hypothetical protein [Sphingomonas ginkgonis]
MRPTSDEDRQNRRGCFIIVVAVLLVLIVLGYFALSVNDHQRVTETLDRYSQKNQ